MLIRRAVLDAAHRRLVQQHRGLGMPIPNQLDLPEASHFSLQVYGQGEFENPLSFLTFCSGCSDGVKVVLECSLMMRLILRYLLCGLSTVVWLAG